MATPKFVAGPQLAAWLAEQNLPTIEKRFGKNDSLYKLQQTPYNIECRLFCGNLKLVPPQDAPYAVYFTLEVSPFQPRMVLELRLQKLEHELYDEDRMRAEFYAIVDGDNAGDYVRSPPTYHQFGAPQPGPFSFSSHLIDTQRNPLADVYNDTPQSIRSEQWTDVPQDKQTLYRWKSKGCVTYNFSRNISKMGDGQQQAAIAFQAIIGEATSNGTEINVLTRWQPKHMVYWGRMAALPYPPPVSQWPWLLKHNGEDPNAVMDFSGRTFELSPAYIDRAFAKRNEYWSRNKDKKNNTKPVEVAINTVPDPLEIIQLPAVTQFHSAREYLARVLGCHTYEYQGNRVDLNAHYYGNHHCEVIPDTAGSARHLVLLTIEVTQSMPIDQASTETMVAVSESQVLPEVGERVQMVIVYQKGGEPEAWDGKVIAMPAAYQKYGHNTAIAAERPPTAGGRVLEASQYQADFQFGEHGASVGKLRARLLRLMVAENIDAPQRWLKRLLLAQNNHGFVSANHVAPSLPTDWQAKVKAACDQRSLNVEQGEAVTHYFTHRLTIVVGPPGTGKSTLVDVILELEREFKCQFWVVAGSNPAVDIIGRKISTRLGKAHPTGFYRIHPAYQETLHDVDPKTCGDTRSSPWPMDATPSLLEEMDLAARSYRTLSLESDIRWRLGKSTEGKNQIYPKEKLHLANLKAAREAVTATRIEPTTPLTQDELAEQVREDMKLRNKAQTALQIVQRNFVARSHGTLTTAAGAGSPLLQDFHPVALIMDESSQIGEAEAVHPLAHAMTTKGRRLDRIMLIGDHLQLPPTVMAERNPFAPQGRVSLMERLINSGVEPIVLREQFRMHPSISSILNKVIYIKTPLRNAPITEQRPEVTQFMEYIKKYAKNDGVNNFPDTCAVIISPTRTEGQRWGSSKHPGTHSKYNSFTAALVFMKVRYLVLHGNFDPKDIMVTAFYDAQVRLIKAIFAEYPHYNGVIFNTVDGSQGDEALIEVVDAVTLGGGANESMGFLGGEKRRFNVAASRPKVGRIVIVHEDFAKGKYDETWSKFIQEAKDNKWLLHDKPLKKGWPPGMAGKVNAVVSKFESARPGKPTTVPRTTGVKLRKEATAYNIRTFVTLTGLTEVYAQRYLQKYDDNLHVAIDAFFQENADGSYDELIANTDPIVQKLMTY